MKKYNLYLKYFITCIILVSGIFYIPSICADDPDNMRPGDFVTLHEWNDWVSDIIKNLFPVDVHSAIYIGDFNPYRPNAKFIEAGPIDVHYATPDWLAHWWKDKSYYYVVDVEYQSVRDAAVEFSDRMRLRLYQEHNQSEYCNYDPRDFIPLGLPERLWVKRQCVRKFQCAELIWAAYMEVTDPQINIAHGSQPNGYGSTGYNHAIVYWIEEDSDTDIFYPNDPPIPDSYEITGTVDINLERDDPENKQWKTIQKGIDNMSQNDVLYVKNGIYQGNIILNKSIILIGENIKNTIIEGTVTMVRALDYEIPNGGKSDIVANVNMTGNELLMHFNNDSDVGEDYSTSNLIYDYSGLGNNGTNNGASWTTDTLKGNGSFDFNGTTDFVNLT